MKYLSVCSGIEAASVAWHHLGWTPIAFSEIEPFPSAVLAHRFPNVPNLGDMTKHKEWPIEPGSIDLLVGGTPCQSFSVAGLRKGLHDPRGGLMLTYLEIAQRLRPRWVVWENVPGVLSSGGGRDFGSFLGALGELGYQFAYRVLDAQWVRTQRHPRAVPQRRRRVFVVGCLVERGAGDRNPAAEVLLESESVCRNPAESPKTRKIVAPDAEAGVGAGSWWDGGDCAGTLTKQNAGGAQRMPDKDNFGAVLQPVASTLGNRGLRSHTELDGHGAYVPVPFTKSKRAQTTEDDETWVDGQVNPTLSLFDSGDTRATTVAVAFSPGNLARGAGASPNSEVAPTMKCSAGRGADDQRTCVAIGTDCYNGAITGDVAATMGTPGSSVNASGPTVMAFDWQSGGDSRGLDPKDTAQLQRCQTPAVAQAMTVRRLTPRECERLQGFPDDWTLIPWRKKPADECPDGPRYKALGNSMAVNCMEWIGERIQAWEDRHA